MQKDEIKMKLSKFHEDKKDLGVKGLKELYINLINKTEENCKTI